MMRKIILLLICLLSYMGGIAQTNTPKIQSLPTSPEAALLGRFGDVPISYYTGTAEVSVPIYNLVIENVEIPVHLDYHTSGVKVSDEATWVGLGWNLAPEGSIIQEVRGKPDREDVTLYINNLDEYNYFKGRFGTVLSSEYMLRMQYGCGLIPICIHSPTEAPYVDGDDIMTRLKDGNGDPDIYNYNFGGYSGKFYINPETQEIVMLDKENVLKFEKNGTSWKATTKEGIIYYFNTIETISSTGNKFANVKGYTFKVSEIKLISGKSIYFNYSEDVNFHVSSVETSHITNFSNNQSNGGFLDIYYSFRNLLTSIESDDTKINFILSSRDDLMPSNIQNPAKKLEKIDVISKSNNKKIKSYKFNYSYFDYDPTYSYKFYDNNNNLSQTTIDYYGKRLKLESIDLINYINQQEDPNKTSYTFEYDISKKMPLKISNSVDYYGYFNGENNNTSLPDLDYFDYFNTTQYKQAPELMLKYPYVGGKRYSNKDFTGAYALNKIVYPTKGYTKLEYEPNSFNNQFIPDKIQNDLAYKNTALVNSGNNTFNNNSVKDFIISKSTTFVFDNEIYDGYTPYNNANSPMYSYNQMLGFKIEFYKAWNDSNGWHTSTIKTWDLSTVTISDFEANHGKKWHDEIRVEFDSSPQIQYHVRIITPGNFYLSNDTYHIAGMKSTFHYYDDLGVDKSMSYGGGLRVKSVKNYDSNNQLISNKTINYYGGRLVNLFEPLSFMLHASYKERPSVQNNGCFDENVAIFNDLSINSNDFGLGSLLVGYDKVEEIENSNSNSATLGKKVFYYNNENVIKPKSLPQIINNNGTLYKEETYDFSNKKVLEKLYNYSIFSYGNIFPAFRIIKNTLGPNYPQFNYYPTLCGNYSGVRNFTLDTNFNYTAYSFWKYPLVSNRYYLNNEEITQYFPNNESLTTHIYHNYNNNYLSSSNITSFPDGETQESTYKYPQDNNNQYLINKNIIGVPLQTITTKTVNSVTQTLSDIETVYPTSDSEAISKTSGLPLPYKVLNKDSQGNVTTDIIYKRYDNKGNILEYFFKPDANGNGQNVAIIWGYNQTHPIAKIEGATYSQIEGYISNIVNASNTDATLDTNASEQSLIDTLDAFRKISALSTYQITTYTYNPLIGVTSITPPSGIREIYKYDSANRLQAVVDINGNILKEYQYNYKQ